MKYFVPVVAILCLTACMAPEEVVEANQREFQEQMVISLKTSQPVCRDGVQYLVGWVGSYHGGPYAVVRTRQDGKPYTCAVKPSAFEETPVE